MINLDALTIGQVKEINSFANNQQTNSASIYKDVIGKICVVRTYSAGVHIGKVKQVTETEVLLENAKRLWKWAGAFTLNEVAEKGIDFENSRISEEVPLILLSQKIEIIPVSNEAQKTYVKKD
jgi:hypothetical protein